MKRIAAFGSILSVVLAWGCASIVSKSTYPVTFDSNPTGAHIVITNKSGNRIFEGRTPTTLTLSASSGFFSPAQYYVEASMDGYNTARATLTAGLDGWYIGNLLFGGLIGMLIVDPATGAMWKLDERMVVNLDAKTAALEQGGFSLRIVTIDQVPTEYRAHLIRVN
ncbi:MAG: hypothetical protein KatS3mg077_2246 [Candidatus Binatia bacterium]|nr:MAG: hypothetical protein KatS3mg077_2246 [Candidatus Binatia bacterium]